MVGSLLTLVTKLGRSSFASSILSWYLQLRSGAYWFPSIASSWWLWTKYAKTIAIGWAKVMLKLTWWRSLLVSYILSEADARSATSPLPESGCLIVQLISTDFTKTPPTRTFETRRVFLFTIIIFTLDWEILSTWLLQSQSWSFHRSKRLTICSSRKGV